MKNNDQYAYKEWFWSAFPLRSNFFLSFIWGWCSTLAKVVTFEQDYRFVAWKRFLFVELVDIFRQFYLFFPPISKIKLKILVS